MVVVSMRGGLSEAQSQHQWQDVQARTGHAVAELGAMKCLRCRLRNQPDAHVQLLWMLPLEWSNTPCLMP
jgi:hypothetical protein